MRNTWRSYAPALLAFAAFLLGPLNREPRSPASILFFRVPRSSAVEAVRDFH